MAYCEICDNCCLFIPSTVYSIYVFITVLFPLHSVIFRSAIIHAEASGGGVPAHAEGEGRAGQRELQQSVDHKAGRSDDHIIT